MTDSTLHLNKHVLVCLDKYTKSLKEYEAELDFIKENFLGHIVRNSEKKLDLDDDAVMYLCGDIKNTLKDIPLSEKHQMFVIKELSGNYEDEDHDVITLGQVPINVYNVGVLFRELFDEKYYFKQIESAHKFQSLTESTKPGKALRTGIYMTHINKTSDDLHFKLLRCSTNLSGPTCNFKDVDNEVINKVNNTAKLFFENPAKLNHVLAQIYHNKEDIVESKKGKVVKQKKARISAHSDKTKDMPDNALMAFTTFYDFNDIKPRIDKADRFNRFYKKESLLTKLHFRLKKQVTDKKYKKEFSVLLYPNSVFLINLETNRLYTHEIRPSALDVDKLPTRMGYVIRCSNTNSVFKENKTFIKENGSLYELRYGNEKEFTDLRVIYQVENRYIEKVDYGKIHFTMNKGDLEMPEL